MNKHIHRHWFVIVGLLIVAVVAAWLFNGQPLVLSIVLVIFAIGAGIQLSAWQIKAYQERQSLSFLRESIEQETKSVETILKELIEELPIGIMFITEEEQIRFNNQVWNDLLSIPGTLKLADFKSHPGLWSVLNRCLGTEDDGEYLWNIDKKYYQVVIKAINSDGKFIGVLVSGSDVSSFKNLERVQQDFLADITHELKTPITALIGVGDILSEKGVGLSKEQLQEFFGIIDKESARLNRLVDDLIDLTRLGSGTLKLSKSMFSLHELVEETATMFNQELKDKNLALTIAVDKELMVFVDHDRFTQVFTNLFSNAVRYTSVGGITVSATKEDKTIAISFKDTGMGIAPDNIERIFNRFYRTDEARSRYKGGSGLGLAIVKEIIKSHNGTIEVKSKIDHGTEFIIRIPKI